MKLGGLLFIDHPVHVYTCDAWRCGSLILDK